MYNQTLQWLSYSQAYEARVEASPPVELIHSPFNRFDYLSRLYWRIFLLRLLPLLHHLPRWLNDLQGLIIFGRLLSFGVGRSTEKVVSAVNGSRSDVHCLIPFLHLLFFQAFVLEIGAIRPYFFSS